MGVIQMNTFWGPAPGDIDQGERMKFFRSLTGLLLVSALVACGGGTGNPSQEAPSERGATNVSVAAAPDLTSGKAAGLESPSYGTPVEGADLALMKQRLAKRFNGRFAGRPDALMGDRQRYAGAKAFQPVAKAYGGTPASVHRFLNIRTGSHFYTMSAEEKASIERNLPQFRYEGQAFFALTASDVPLSPVYRFYSIYTGTHFYTIDPEERDYVRTYYWEYFNYEGIAWFATTFAGPGWTPMHRFFNNAAGTHFYTASEDERLSVIATAPHMEYEGIGYYVRTSGAALPVSPITSSNAVSRLCPGGDTENCETAAQMPPSSHVEGNREGSSGINRFVQLPGQPETDCRVDKATGLVWEVKADSGPRNSTRRFLHIDRTDRPQVVVLSADFGPSGFTWIHVPRTPTQAELDLDANSHAYVEYLNTIGLCGFSDWRIPTASELVNVVNFEGEGILVPGSYTLGTYISADSATWDYDVTYASGDVLRHSVDGVVTVSASPSGYSVNNPYAAGNFVDYGFRAVEEAAQVGTSNNSNHLNLMLVRGPVAPSASRYTALTIPYGGDAANNVLVDNWSKLQWRRCAEGQSWTGTTCVGQPLSLNLYDALSRTAALPGWRLPGIKELESLYRRDPDTSKVQMDLAAFPMNGFSPGALPFWSMSVHWRTLFDSVLQKAGRIGYQASFEGVPTGIPSADVRKVSRFQPGYIRLVRVHP